MLAPPAPRGQASRFWVSEPEPCLETAAYAFGNENLRFELGPAPGNLCKGKSPKFCSICADGCHLVVTGARISDPFLVASSRKMLAEGGACAGVFLPVRLHLTPGVRARFGRVARVSTRVVSLISVLRQGVNFLLIAASYFAGLLLLTPLNREIGEFGDITVRIQQIPSSPGDSKHQTYLLSLEENTVYLFPNIFTGDGTLLWVILCPMAHSPCRAVSPLGGLCSLGEDIKNWSF